MGLFFRKRVYSEQEIQLIEKIEKRIEVLIKEWDQSYKGQEFLLEHEWEGFMRGLKRLWDWRGVLDANLARPTWAIIIKEKRIYCKLWTKMIKIFRKVNRLVRKGNYQKPLKL